MEDDAIKHMISIYDHNINEKYHPSSDLVISIIGGILLWVGWLYFNCVSGYEVVDYTSSGIPSLIAINTLLAPSSSALTFCLLEFTNFNRDASSM